MRHVAYYKGCLASLGLIVDAGAGPMVDDYYARVIKPLADSDHQIIYIGEINSAQKKLWYLHAQATVFPIQWGEPFGLVLVESMACGTPVVAFSKGAVPEIVAHGKTGFVVDSLEPLIAAANRIDTIDPVVCRSHVRDRFSLDAMARNYVALYHRVVPGRRPLFSYAVSGSRIGRSNLAITLSGDSRSNRTTPWRYLRSCLDIPW